jgi:hypothetical protein
MHQGPESIRDDDFNIPPATLLFEYFYKSGRLKLRAHFQKYFLILNNYEAGHLGGLIMRGLLSRIK